VIKRKDGRRNRYQVQAHLPVPGPGTREPAIGEVLALFAGPARGSSLDPPGRLTVIPAASGSLRAQTASPMRRVPPPGSGVPLTSGITGSAARRNRS
jgi:hypothetical protein